MSEDSPQGESEAGSEVRLSEGQRKIAHGLALVEQGHSYRYAAAQVGVHNTTLLRAQKRLLGSSSTQREEKLREAEDRIVALATVGAEKGLQRMVEEIDDVEPRHVTAWTTVMRDTLSKKRRWERQEEQGAGAGLERALGRLGEHGDVTLTVRRRDPSEEAIDVTPRQGEGEGDS